MPLGDSYQLTGQVRGSDAESREHEALLHAKRFTEIPSNGQLRCAYSSTDGLPDYLGYAPRGLATNASGWLIQKYTYDGSRQMTLRQIAYDAWDNRATTATYA